MGLVLGSNARAYVGKWLGLSPKGLKHIVKNTYFFMKFFTVFDGFGGFVKV